MPARQVIGGLCLYVAYPRSPTLGLSLVASVESCLSTQTINRACACGQCPPGTTCSVSDFVSMPFKVRICMPSEGSKGAQQCHR